MLATWERESIPMVAVEENLKSITRPDRSMVNEWPLGKYARVPPHSLRTPRNFLYEKLLACQASDYSVSLTS